MSIAAQQVVIGGITTLVNAAGSAFLVRSRETHPIGRPGTPEEIADPG